MILIAGQAALHDGTELVVRLEQSLSSEKVRVGDAVKLTVVQALKIGDCVVIAQDAVVEGRVIVARRKTSFGRNGFLDIAAERVQTADGSWVRLRHAPVKTADPVTTGFSKIGTTAGLIWYAPAAPVILMFAKGKEVWVPKSARFKVYTNEPRDVQAQCESPLPKR
ncbi:MAG: hypothetical protein ACREPG_01365 [Candidatus Binatia bacterium]